jgi:hypothetical protein
MSGARPSRGWCPAPFLLTHRPTASHTLDPPQDNEHNQNNQNESKPTTRVIAPACTLGPQGQRSQQQEDEDNQKDQAHGGPFLEASLGGCDLFRHLRHDDCKRRLRCLGLNLERQCLDHAHPGAEVDLAGATDFDEM